jgi:hypothetical protein
VVHKWVVGICRGHFALGSGNKHGLRIGRHDWRQSEASSGARLVDGIEMVDSVVAIVGRVRSPWPRGSCRELGVCM